MIPFRSSYPEPFHPNSTEGFLWHHAAPHIAMQALMLHGISANTRTHRYITSETQIQLQRKLEIHKYKCQWKNSWRTSISNKHQNHCSGRTLKEEIVIFLPISNLCLKYILSDVLGLQLKVENCCCQNCRHLNFLRKMHLLKTIICPCNFKIIQELKNLQLNSKALPFIVLINIMGNLTKHWIYGLVPIIIIMKYHDDEVCHL